MICAPRSSAFCTRRRPRSPGMRQGASGSAALASFGAYGSQGRTSAAGGRKSSLSTTRFNEVRNLIRRKYTMANLEKIVEELSSPDRPRGRSSSPSCSKRSGAFRLPLRSRLPLLRRAAAAAGSRRRTEFDRHPRRRRRQEDQRHQGSPRDHRSRPQGSQGPGRRRRRRRSRKACPRPMLTKLKAQLEAEGAKVELK